MIESLASAIGRHDPDRPRWWHGVLVATVALAGVAASTGLDEPPRFDGAGYTMLARALLDGDGYRNIDHPEHPSHAHFPPGYPALLALLWSVTGRSAAAAHLLSIACTVAASVVSWHWFRRLYPTRIALLLALALASNWTWHRIGGAIRSEPPYMLLKQAALLGAIGVARSKVAARGLGLGMMLGALTLFRHIGVAVGVAIAIDLILRRRPRAASALALGAILVAAPWGWRLLTTPRPTQLGLLPGRSLPEVLAGNLWFYVLRLPDALSGPFVEVGTVFRPVAYPVAAGFAIAAAGVLLVGLRKAARTPRLRPSALVIASNLALLLIWPFTEAGRFLVPLVPALLVVALEGLATIARRLRIARPKQRAATLLLLAALPYATYAAVSGRAGAERLGHRDVDDALDWIDREAERPGPILSSYPAEAHWATDRPGLAPPDDPLALEEAIDRYRVAYVLVAEDRFANAGEGPMARYIADHPSRVRLAWSAIDGRVEVFEIDPPP